MTVSKFRGLKSATLSHSTSRFCLSALPTVHFLLTLFVMVAVRVKQIINPIGDEWLGERVNPYSDPWYRYARLLAMLDQQAKVVPGSSWLDAGCHGMELLRLVYKRYEVKPTGIDQWDAGTQFDSWCRYVQSDIGREGFGIDEQFDFISALEILEHMIDTDKFLDECHAHLNPNGYLLISTPNICSLRNRITVPLGYYPAGLEYKNVIHHVRLYNVQTLNAHLAEHGFKLCALGGLNLLPARFHSNSMLRKIGETLAWAVPQLCSDLIAVYQAT